YTANMEKRKDNTIITVTSKMGLPLTRVVRSAERITDRVQKNMPFRRWCTGPGVSDKPTAMAPSDTMIPVWRLPNAEKTSAGTMVPHVRRRPSEKYWL